MSFPVAGTLMIEPTESESLAEIDRFCDAMIAIAAEIQSIADGNHQENKYWPPVNRVNNALGDRALICACPPMEFWEQQAAE